MMESFHRLSKPSCRPTFRTPKTSKPKSATRTNGAASNTSAGRPPTRRIGSCFRVGEPCRTVTGWLRTWMGGSKWKRRPRRSRWSSRGLPRILLRSNSLPSHRTGGPRKAQITLIQPHPNQNPMSDLQPVTWYDDPAHFRKASRREFLFTGLVGGLGLSLGNLFKLRALETDVYEPKAQSLIHIFLPGGMAHHESWDPKPLAPIEYRGPLGTVATKIPGVKVSQNLAQTAQIADKLTIVRGMTHGEAAHERGTHNMFTGYRPSPAIQFPSIGAVVSHELGSRKNLPPYVCVPGIPNEFAGTGYLSTAYGPFSLGSDPANKGFKVRDLNMRDGITPERFDRRRNILSTVDEHFRTLEKSDALSAMDSFYQAAYALVSSKDA